MRRARGILPLVLVLVGSAIALEAESAPNSPIFQNVEPHVEPKLELENWVLSQSHPFFGNTSRTWAETSGRFGLVFHWHEATIETGLLGVHTWGEDPYGTGNRVAGAPEGAGEQSTVPDFELDLAYLDVENVGGLPLRVTIGRQPLKIGTQFLIGDGVFDGFTRSTQQGVWHNPRRNFDAIRLRSSVGGFDLDGFVYRVDPTWDAGFGDDGVFGGAEASRKLDATGGTYTLGGFYRASHSNDDNDMIVLDGRGEQPIPWLAGAYVSGEATGEIGTCRSIFYCDRPGESMLEHAWHAEVGVRAKTRPLKPFFEAGYVYYSPDFTPIAYGFADWGKWYVGNQLDWLIYSSNAKIWRADLGFWPHEKVQARFLYVNTRQVAPTGDSRGGTVSDEFTWVLSWYPTKWLWAIASVGYSIPRRAFVESRLENPFEFVNENVAQVGSRESVDLLMAVGIHY